MASSILPTPFTSGDFGVWIRQFQRCAAANKWNTEAQLLKLPAFLDGPAATYYETLSDGDKTSLDSLVASLHKCFCPPTDRERYYREFEDHRLRPAEDPTLFLWRLKESLRNAEPDLSGPAFDALLRRQFFKGLPEELQLKLLESDPTPTLATMTSFAQRFRSLQRLPTSPATACAAVATSPLAMEDKPLYQQQQQQQLQLDNVTGLLSKLAEGQASLIAAISSSAARQPSSVMPPRRPGSSVRCFFCGAPGHIVRNCEKRQRAQKCTLCNGWGHHPQNCANNFDLSQPNSDLRQQPDQSPVELHSGQKVAKFLPVVESLPARLRSSVDNICASVVCQPSMDPCTLQELETAISSSLSSHDRNQLFQTLLEYPDVFNNGLGHTTVISHKINTGDSPPIRQHPRRLPYHYRGEVDKQVQDMLTQGVIKPSTSPWSSPIVLVKKKDGSYRFCIDYRKLNLVTKHDAIPLPRIDDLLDALNGYNIFSTLDLRSGYWQVSVDPEDREKTAFMTPTGLYEFLRMPYGLSTAPATFSRAISVVLSGLAYETCLCYFDDVIVFSKDINQHCDRLKSVLQRFREQNLRVKASKCSFGSHEVAYLGHTISKDGIHTDPKKVKAIQDIPAPSTLEELRSFLGLAGYYRRFIPEFATIASPLMALTKKATRFLWTDITQKAFEYLKTCLCSAPILAYPCLNKTFILQTDASDVGLGAVLTQLDESGHERVISYASRTLTSREQNYTAMEKEALAVVFATDHFRVYLLGRQFQLITDNRALKWLHSIQAKEHNVDWDDWLAQAVFAYNTSVHESTGISPYEMVFGRPARMPIEVELGVPLRNPTSQSNYSQSLRKALSHSNQLAQRNLVNARAKQASQYDNKSKRNWQPFESGQTVWLWRPKHWKFGKRWTGPYRIQSRDGVNYRLTSSMGKSLVAHHNLLKPCVLPLSPGIPVHPGPETPGITPSETVEAEIDPAAGNQRDIGGGAARPNRPPFLRQVVNPPIRFGNVVAH
eukprot:gene16602-biopygen14025